MFLYFNVNQIVGTWWADSYFVFFVACTWCKKNKNIWEPPQYNVHTCTEWNILTWSYVVSRLPIFAHIVQSTHRLLLLSESEKTPTKKERVYVFMLHPFHWRESNPFYSFPQIAHPVGDEELDPVRKADYTPGTHYSMATGLCENKLQYLLHILYVFLEIIIFRFSFPIFRF